MFSGMEPAPAIEHLALGDNAEMVRLMKNAGNSKKPWNRSIPPPTNAGQPRSSPSPTTRVTP